MQKQTVDRSECFRQPRKIFETPWIHVLCGRHKVDVVCVRMCARVCVIFRRQILIAYAKYRFAYCVTSIHLLRSCSHTNHIRYSHNTHTLINHRANPNTLYNRTSAGSMRHWIYLQRLERGAQRTMEIGIVSFAKHMSVIGCAHFAATYSHSQYNKLSAMLPDSIRQSHRMFFSAHITLYPCTYYADYVAIELQICYRPNWSSASSLLFSFVLLTSCKCCAIPRTNEIPNYYCLNQFSHFCKQNDCVCVCVFHFTLLLWTTYCCPI